jgi:hypothetical protein
MRIHIAAACLKLLIQTLSVSPQQPAVKGSIEGTIMCSGAGDSIPGARVTLNSNGPTAITDGQGIFIFKELNPGAYRLSAGANGFAKQEYGQRTFGGQGDGDPRPYL